MKQHFELAVRNIVRFGDTDIFPFPYETRMFEDAFEDVVASLVDTHANFKMRLVEAPPVNVSTTSTVGYTGYRWATQIDPYWNAYFLGLVISLGEEIEKSRCSRALVYSYRFKTDTTDSSLFDKTVGWRNFQQDSLDLAIASPQLPFVVSCDIADFYPRVYHHRLENALDRLDPAKDRSFKLKKLLQTFSGTNSYGLPVDGPAARLLAELALDSLDHLLEINQVILKRYVDDFIIFAGSKEEAHSHLTLLSRKLMENEGLTLQKTKTNLMSREEFISLTSARLRGFDEDEDSPMKARFLSLPIRFDPYSPTAAVEYEAIKASLGDFDLLGMLGSEFQKSKINQPFSRQLIRAFAVTEPHVLSGAFRIIFDSIVDLYPIFSTIAQVAISNWERFEPATQKAITDAVVKLIREDSFILKTEINLGYVIRLLARQNTPQAQILVAGIYRANPSSMLVATLATQAMGRWKVHYLLSDMKRTFPTMNPWQRRAFVVCSPLLGDEGDHWHAHNKAKFDFIEWLYAAWAIGRASAGTLQEAL
jgi:hypothetical protein